VIVLLQISSWFWQWNNFENRLIFDEVKAYQKAVPFWGHRVLYFIVDRLISEVLHTWGRPFWKSITAQSTAVRAHTRTTKCSIAFTSARLQPTKPRVYDRHGDLQQWGQPEAEVAWAGRPKQSRDMTTGQITIDRRSQLTGRDESFGNLVLPLTTTSDRTL